MSLTWLKSYMSFWNVADSVVDTFLQLRERNFPNRLGCIHIHKGCWVSILNLLRDILSRIASDSLCLILLCQFLVSAVSVKAWLRVPCLLSTLLVLFLLVNGWICSIIVSVSQWDITKEVNTPNKLAIRWCAQVSFSSAFLQISGIGMIKSTCNMSYRSLDSIIIHLFFSSVLLFQR